MKCAYHPTIDAVATCSTCGRAICGGCVVDTGERVTCRTCLEGRSRPAAAYGPRNNQSALWSMILGLGGWVIFLLNIVLNFVVLPIVAVATIGIGSICMVCTVPAGALPLVAWLVAVIMGHVGISALNRPGNEETGHGMAVTGLVSGYIGLGLSLIGCVLLAIALAMGISIPLIDAMSSY